MPQVCGSPGLPGEAAVTDPGPLPGSGPRAALSGRWLLVVLIGLCCAIEAALQLSAWTGLAPRLRALAFENGGFWTGLLLNWSPNYAAQPYAMFLTHGFLHGGLVHLAVNMLALWSLGQAVLDRVGPLRFTLLYLGALPAGGLGHAVLATSPAPMVGASGALFGLAGGLMAWAYVDRFNWGESLLPVLRGAALLVAMNVALWWVLDGQLAWQAHLGGFIAGWVLALLLDPRPRNGPDAG